MPVTGEKFLWSNFFAKKDETQITIVSTLRDNELFKQLSKRELEYVAKIVHVRHYQPSETIFSQYEKGLGMYMIAKGSVEIKVRPPHAHKNDPEIPITVLSAGSFLGELALVDDTNKRTASAYAREPTMLLGFFKPDLLDLMERRPDVGVKILYQLAKIIGRRLNETTEYISTLRYSSQLGDGSKK